MEKYIIDKSTLTSLANNTRRLINTENKLSLNKINTELSVLNNSDIVGVKFFSGISPSSLGARTHLFLFNDPFIAEHYNDENLIIYTVFYNIDYSLYTSDNQVMFRNLATNISGAPLMVMNTLNAFSNVYSVTNRMQINENNAPYNISIAYNSIPMYSNNNNDYRNCTVKTTKSGDVILYNDTANGNVFIPKGNYECIIYYGEIWRKLLVYPVENNSSTNTILTINNITE